MNIEKWPHVVVPNYKIISPALASFTVKVKNYVFPSFSSLRNLQGPIYDIKRDHRFAEVVSCLNEIKDLKGPVYNIENNHHFNIIEKNVQDLRKLNGPVYNIDDR